MTDIVVLNEIRVNQSGPDFSEYVELSGTPGTSLDGLSIIELSDDGATGTGTISSVIALDGFSLGDNGLFTVGSPSLERGSVDAEYVDPNDSRDEPQPNFANSQSSTFILVRGFRGDVGQDLDTDDDGVLDSTPWDAVLDSVSLTSPAGDALPYSSVLVGPDPGNGDFPPAHIYRATDTTGDWVAGQFQFTGDTAGSLNDPDGADNSNLPATAGDAGGIGSSPLSTATEVTIAEVQGSGEVSPLVDQAVVVEGVVTGDFQSNGQGLDGDLGGVFIQSVTQDGDPTTSDGIFVTGLDIDVNPGDVVRVEGVVLEVNGETRINVSSAEIVEAEAFDDPTQFVSVIEAVDGQLPDLEAFEGMLVSLGESTITSVFRLDNVGEVTLSFDGVIEPFTQTSAPSVEGYAAFLERVAGSTITLNDGFGDIAADLTDFNGLTIDFNTEFGIGDTIGSFLGIIAGDGPDSFSINAIEDIQFTNSVVRELSTDIAFNFEEITVASLNVENFFTSLGDGTRLGGNNPLNQERGVDTQAEFNAQLDRLAQQIGALDADVLALQEIEDNGLGDDSAIQLLVETLFNQGFGQYSIVSGYIDPDGNPVTNVGGGDAIQNIVLYRADRVEVTEGITPVAIDDIESGRLPLVVSFTDLVSGEDFTLVNVHHRARSGSIDLDDGQAANAALREQASQAIQDFLDDNDLGFDDPDVLILGDFNAYALEPAVTSFADDGFTNLFDVFDGESQITFSFGATAGALDHILASESLLAQIQDFAVFNVNAEEADFFGVTNLDVSPFASFIAASDHNPLIVTLRLEPQGLSLEGTAGADTLRGTDGDDSLQASEGADLLIGALGFDIVDYSSANDALEIDLGAFTDIISIDGDVIAGFGGDTLIGIEGIIGSNFGDALTAGPGSALLLGRAGEDTLTGSFGEDTLNGGGRDDLLDGQRGNDSLIGAPGDDTLIGGPGGDTLIGGTGDDNLSGGNARDRLLGGSGADTLDGGDGLADSVVYSTSRAGVFVTLGAKGEAGSGSGGDAEGDILINVERVTGSPFDDSIVGNEAANLLIGLDGDDNISAGAGDDIINAGSGDDTLVGGAGADILRGQGGIDIVDYSASSDAVQIDLQARSGAGGDAEGDVIIAVEGVIGSAFGDVLSGTGRADLIAGGEGDDTLTGGKGADRFVFSSNSGADQITDFNAGEDIIDLTELGGNAGITLEQLLASATQTGDILVLSLGDGNTLSLLGITADNLASDNFAF